MKRLVAAILALGWGTVMAANPQPPPTGCDAKTHPEHHQFDFWLGSWDVTSKTAVAGKSRIESISEGCGISEHWEGVGGSRGVSYNAWDPSTKKWQQFWVGNTGGDVLHLEGGFENGHMVLSGTRPNATTGKPQIQRITWTPNPDRTVRQLWEQSDDDGKTWSVAFDGLYRRTSG
jgi:hypothetical protein